MNLESKEITGETTIQQIPENILLEIFKYLPVKDRCLSGRVCRQWRRIVCDNSLWRHVDLVQYRLDLRKMWTVLRAHFSPCLLTMKMRGHIHAGSSRRKKTSLSDAMLKELGTRCPNLWLLHLYDCNTNNLSFESIPTSITSLSLTYCTWQPRWLKNKEKHLPHLTNLNLSFSIRIDNFDLEDISHFTNLKTLSLSGCYRIYSAAGTGVEIIAKKLSKLESLNLAGTCIDDLAIHHISRHMKELKELVIANCSDLTDESLAVIATGLPKLNILDIANCESISIKGLELLFTSKLKFLTVIRMVRLTEEEISKLKNGFPHRVYLSA